VLTVRLAGSGVSQPLNNIMTAQNPSLSELQKLLAAKKARIKGGRNRWKGSTPKQRSDALRAVALAKSHAKSK